MTSEHDASPGVDLERPNAARIYDCLLGGSHNFAVDRALAEKAVRNLPIVQSMAWTNREFLGRAVQYCARHGIRQFLDLGSGIPTVGNVHEIANEVSGQTRCVYVDFEPVAVAHSRLVLEQHAAPKRYAVVEDNLLNVDAVWNSAMATGVLDPNQPIALIMVAVLHYVLSERKAQTALQRYRELLPAGSYLVLSHVTRTDVPDDLQPALEAMQAQFNTNSSTPACYRQPREIAAFFGEFDLLEPGLVWLPQWHPEERDSPASAEAADSPNRTCMLGGVGRKSTL
jgi:O-methyltransferase involved in polyketide biosynthesis